VNDTAADGDTLFPTTDLQDGTPSDTAVVSEGKFTFDGKTDSTQMAIIFSPRSNDLNTPLFIESGHISVTLSRQPGSSRVGGTKMNNLWQQHTDSVVSIGREINKIAEHIYGATVSAEEQQQGMEQIERITKRFARLAVRTAEENIDNEFGYFLLNYYPDDIIDNASRSRLIALMPQQMRQRPTIQEMEATMAQKAKTAEGNTLPDFTLPTPDGQPLSIMSVVSQHRITIIDFWASWCGPCRQEMPQGIQLYNDYKDKGLEIIGLSLDSDRGAWLQAIKQLQLPWPQMSDLKGGDSDVAQQFSISSIPHTIIVDQQGKILRRGLRGEALRQFVAEHLK
jgi:thiol-disulfide isomerase/thioredoxin